MFDNELMSQIRDRFCHVDTCPYQGPRIFFENAGGALTLKSVVEVNTQLAGIPDNQGRDNPASHELVRIINEPQQNATLCAYRYRRSAGDLRIRRANLFA